MSVGGHLLLARVQGGNCEQRRVLVNNVQYHDNYKSIRIARQPADMCSPLTCGISGQNTQNIPTIFSDHSVTNNVSPGIIVATTKVNSGVKESTWEVNPVGAQTLW